MKGYLHKQIVCQVRIIAISFSIDISNIMLEDTSETFNKDRKCSSKEDKMASLHRMLDKELNAVGDIFHSKETFDQIEAKLKELEVKLGTLSKESQVVSRPVVRKREYSLAQSGYSYLQGRKYWDSSHRATRINQQSNMCSIKQTKTKKKIGSSTKLNFEEEYLSNKKNSPNKKSKTSVKKNKSDSNLFSNKILRKVSPPSTGLKANKSTDLKDQMKKKHRSASKNKNKQLIHSQPTSEKKKKGSSIERKFSAKNIVKGKVGKELFSTEKKFESSKKLGSSKKLLTAQTDKILKRESSTLKNVQNKHKSPSKKVRDRSTSLQKRIHDFQKKKLAQELDSFKRKNQVLQKRVQALKGFQDEFMKLKQVFDKGKIKTRNK